MVDSGSGPSRPEIRRRDSQVARVPRRGPAGETGPRRARRQQRPKDLARLGNSLLPEQVAAYTAGRSEILVRIVLRDVALLVVTFANAILFVLGLVLSRHSSMLAPLVAALSLVGAIVVTQHSRIIHEKNAWLCRAIPFPHWDASTQLAALRELAMPVRRWANCLAFGGPPAAVLVLNYHAAWEEGPGSWAFRVAVCLSIGIVLVLWKGYPSLPQSSAVAPPRPGGSRGPRSREAHPSFSLAAMVVFIGLALVIALLTLAFKQLGDPRGFAMVALGTLLAFPLAICSIALFARRIGGAMFERIIASVLNVVAQRPSWPRRSRRHDANGKR